MNRFFLGLIFLLLFSSLVAVSKEQKDYDLYHEQVIKAEQFIVRKDYKAALELYEQLFRGYDFVFLRDYQVATQLALHGGDQQKAMIYLKSGILAGWELKSIKKNNFLGSLLESAEFKLLENEYPELRKTYESKLNIALKSHVKEMFSKDQKMALKALLKIGQKAKEKYYENKFAPHSEHQMAEFRTILNTEGYPGEKLIGNTFWMVTILSHHNSISADYNARDSLFPSLKPQLRNAIRRGEMSPYEYALVDDWYRSVKFSRKEPRYGILDEPIEAHLPKTNELRALIGARPYELRDELCEIENITGMNFYLTDRWY